MRKEGGSVDLFGKIKEWITKSAATKAVAIITATIILGGGVVSLVYAGICNSAKVQLGKAVTVTFATEESAAEKTFGLGELLAAMKENGTELGIEASVEELPVNVGMGEVTLSNVGIGMVLRTNTLGESNLNADVNVMNMALLSARAYANKEKVQVTVPKLLKDIFSVNYRSETFKEDLENCYLVDYAGVSQEKLKEILEIFPERTENTECPDAKEIEKRFYEILFHCITDNFEEVELKKSGKADVMVEDEVLNCKVYSAEIFRGYISDFFSEYTLLTQNYIKELVKEYGITALEVDYAFSKLNQAVRFIRGFITDVTVDFYVSENRLVKVRVDWGVEWYLNEQEGCLELTFAASGNPLENMQLELVLPIHEDNAKPEIPKRLEFSYQVTTENTENTYSVEYRVQYNGKPMRLSLNHEKLGGDFILVVKNGIKSLAITGAIGELEKGRKIGLEVKDYVYAEGDYTEEQELNVSIYLKVLEDTVTPLKGEERDALALTEADVAALKEEVIVNIYKLAFSMLGVLQ